MLQKVTNKMPKSINEFHCEKCNFTCSKQSNFNKHLMTAKHINTSDVTKSYIKNAKRYTCDYCNKIYTSRMGLWRHNQKCQKCQINEVQNDNNISNSNPDMIQTMMQLIKQNQEFKELIVELSKKDTTTNNTINNNNHQKFNLNFFLNDTCKDAMNMSEFIENMNVQFEDIENIGRDGYVTGMTNMILSRIKNLEVTKRPMHCTDLKRETIYIKDNNVWEKDNDNTKLHNMIQCIAHKNYAILPAWRDKNPDCLDSDTSKFDFCIKMMTNLLGDAGEGQVRLDNKVIRNLSKSIIIHKTNDTI
jgi:hypothetical protein